MDKTEECRATVQVHVVAVDCPKPSTKHAIIYWQVKKYNWSDSRHERLRSHEERVTRQKKGGGASRIELIQENVKKREMCRYPSNCIQIARRITTRHVTEETENTPFPQLEIETENLSSEKSSIPMPRGHAKAAPTQRFIRNAAVPDNSPRVCGNESRSESPEIVPISSPERKRLAIWDLSRRKEKKNRENSSSWITCEPRVYLDTNTIDLIATGQWWLK